MAGIAKIIELMDLDIPVIGNGDQFDQFISNTPVGSRSVAIVGDAIFKSQNAISKHVFSVVYYKQKTQDILYSFDSSYYGYCHADLNIKKYFRDNFVLYAPKINRQEYGGGTSTCHAYAIHDAYLLKRKIQLEKCLADYLPTSGNTNERYFELNKAFFYDASVIKKSLFKKIILYVEDFDLKNSLTT